MMINTVFIYDYNRIVDEIWITSDKN